MYFVDRAIFSVRWGLEPRPFIFGENNMNIAMLGDFIHKVTANLG